MKILFKVIKGLFEKAPVEVSPTEKAAANFWQAIRLARLEFRHREDVQLWLDLHAEWFALEEEHGRKRCTISACEYHKATLEVFEMMKLARRQMIDSGLEE